MFLRLLCLTVGTVTIVKALAELMRTGNIVWCGLGAALGLGMILWGTFSGDYVL